MIKFGRRIILGAFLLILVVPLIFFTAISIGGALGCELHDASPNACLLFGIDIGGLLYSASLSIFFITITIPLGGILFLIGLTFFIVGILREKNKHK